MSQSIADNPGWGDQQVAPTAAPSSLSIFTTAVRSQNSHLGTHVEITDYIVKLFQVGISTPFQPWQLKGNKLEEVVKVLCEVEAIHQSWVDVLTTIPMSDDVGVLAAEAGARYDDPNDPSLKLILLHAHLALHRFTTHASNYVEEEAWTDSLKALLVAIMDSASRAKASTNDRDTSNKVVRLLDLKNLRAVKPDVVVGLNRELVIVRAREGEPPLSDTDTQLGLQLYILTRRLTPRQSGPWIEADVLVENSDVVAADHWFSFISIDVKGCLGTTAKVDIQDRIAMRINLGIIFRLAFQARHADPGTFRAPDHVMRRTYGLTVVTKTWELYVMIAETDEGDDLKVKAYTVVQLDYGSLTNPTSLLNLISHLRRIRSESSTRHDFIGNWLYCLRDHSETEASAAAVTAAAPVNTTPTKRKRNTHSVAGGQRGRGGGRGGGRGRGGTGAAGAAGAAGAVVAAGGDYARSIRQSRDPKLRIRRGQREVVVHACKFSFPNRKLVEAWVEKVSSAGSDERGNGRWVEEGLPD